MPPANERNLTRRSFLAGTAAAIAAPGALASETARAAEAAAAPIKLGMDNFSVRAFGWKAPQLIDYAASLKLDVLLLSDLDVYESHEPDYLKSIGAKAKIAGIELQAGTGSICPTSNSFNAKYGEGPAHLLHAIQVAKAVGSSVVRCYLGNMRDREGDGGIERHIEKTVAVCQAARSAAVNSGVKIAIENHAGDMRADELRGLIEAAGKDFVGATMDSGNATWTIEDPMEGLEILGPYAVTTGMRDSQVWGSPEGALVQWTAMGEGDVNWNAYLERYRALCPSAAFVLEIISGGGPRAFPYLKPEFWKPFPKVRAESFAKFARMAAEGAPYQAPPIPPAASDAERDRNWQKAELEKSAAFCREKLGLGVRGRG